jgi:hypothetical protein
MRGGTAIYIESELILGAFRAVPQLLFANECFDAVMAEGVPAHGEQARRVLLGV